MMTVNLILSPSVCEMAKQYIDVSNLPCVYTTAWGSAVTLHSFRGLGLTAASDVCAAGQPKIRDLELKGTLEVIQSNSLPLLLQMRKLRPEVIQMVGWQGQD